MLSERHALPYQRTPRIAGSSWWRAWHYAPKQARALGHDCAVELRTCGLAQLGHEIVEATSFYFVYKFCNNTHLAFPANA
jgi:hypothetical protein